MKVAICGAGIAGLALANQLAAHGIEVVVLERARAPRGQGYMIDFFGPGYDAIEAMGLLSAAEAVAYTLDEAVLLDENGRRRAGLDPAQFANGPQLDFMRPDLERVLREHLPSEVQVRYGATLVGVDDLGDSVRVTLDDGTEVTADLLVGADGVHSTVRRLVFGPEQRFLRYLGFQTAAYVFDSPDIHRETRGRFCLTDTIGRQMGFYGLRDGRVAAYAVHRAADPTLPGDPREAVRTLYGGLGWVVPDALDKCPPPEQMYYDQVAQIVMPTWSKGRVALVGDACYAVSLLAGLGASLGVAGSYILAEQLHRAPSIEEALSRYEQMWRPLAEEKQKVGRDGARWFLPETAMQLRLRRTALRLMRLPVVNRYVAAIVGGKSSAVIRNLRDAGATAGLVGTAPGQPEN